MGEGNAASEPRYRVPRWTVENGLPQNSIKALAQTRDGYVWLGTLKGLARFDGVRFRVFDHGNTPEMTHDSINDLALDAADGGLWIGTGDGLLYYRDCRFERHGQQEGITGPVGPLWPAREGGVWFSPRPGQVAFARGGRVETWEFGPERKENIVHQLGEESPSQLLALLGSTGRYCTFHRLDLNRKSLTALSVPRVALREEPACSSFFQDADGLLWLCTSDGIWHGNEKTWTRISSTEPGPGPRPQRVYQTRDGELWVTAFDGNRISLQRLAQNELQPFIAPELPAELNVTHFLEDREGDLWVGSMAGLFRLEPKRLRVYSRRNGLRSDDTPAVAEGADGTIWVGTAAGISGIRDGIVTNLPSPEEGAEWPRVTVLLADRHNALWVGWQEGYLARFERGQWQKLLAPPELGKAADLKALFEDREGRIWVGAGSGGVFRLDRGQWTSLPTTNGLSNPDVRVIFQDRRGGLWFGTYGGGLNRLQEGELTAYKTDRGELNNRAWWIHEDADGVFWVGSEDGLNRFVPPDVDEIRNPQSAIRNRQSLLTSAATGENGGRFFTFTTEQGLGENVVNNIQEDEFGYLWLSGLRGIYRISRQQLNQVAAGQRASVECVAYGEADGMLNSECNGGDNQPAGCKDRSGRIWFPTAQGVVVIDPKEMQQTESAPPVVIEQVRANGEVIFGDGIHLQSKVQSPKSKVGRGLALSHQPSTINYRLSPAPRSRPGAGDSLHRQQPGGARTSAVQVPVGGVRRRLAVGRSEPPGGILHQPAPRELHVPRHGLQLAWHVERAR
jgi:ligand-binding sensor domain-containing protein